MCLVDLLGTLMLKLCKKLSVSIWSTKEDKTNLMSLKIQWRNFQYFYNIPQSWIQLVGSKFDYESKELSPFSSEAFRWGVWWGFQTQDAYSSRLLIREMKSKTTELAFLKSFVVRSMNPRSRRQLEYRLLMWALIIADHSSFTLHSFFFVISTLFLTS